MGRSCSKHNAGIAGAPPRPAHRAALLADRNSVHVLSGGAPHPRVFTVREFLRRDPDALFGDVSEVVVPFTAHAAVRARLLLSGQGRRVLLARSPSVHGEGGTREALLSLLALPAEACVASGEDDASVALLTLLYRRYLAVTEDARREKLRLVAVEAEWPSALRVAMERRLGAGVAGLEAERGVLLRALRGLMEERLPHVLRVVAPPGPRGQGIGPASAAAVITHIVHPARFPSPGALAWYAGLGAEGGRALCRTRGRPARYHPGFKAALVRLARLGWATKSPEESHWKGLYLAERERCLRNHALSCRTPRCSVNAHVSAMAWRRVLRRYLVEVYLGWRAALALRKTPAEMEVAAV